MAYTRLILPNRCSNGHRIGYKQKEFEEYLEVNYSKIEDLTEENKRIITNEALEHFGWGKLCCRMAYINARIPIISDSNKVVYTDTIGLSEKKVIRSQDDIIYKSGIKFIPTKDVPLFPGEDEIEDSDSEESYQEVVITKKVVPFRLIR